MFSDVAAAVSRFAPAASTCAVSGPDLCRVHYAIVRSVLEYAAIIWTPSAAGHIAAIESVQNLFARVLFFRLELQYVFPDAIITTESNSSYLSATMAGSVLGLFSLCERRNILCLLFFHDLLHGRIDDSFLLAQIGFYVPARTLRPRPLFVRSFSRASFLSNLAFERFGLLEASLPPELDILLLSRQQFAVALSRSYCI